MIITRRLGVALFALLAGTASARSPYRQVLSFTITTNVGIGNEVFVAGGHGDVGNWEPTKAPKLYWTTGNVWTGLVGVQSGTVLDYKFVSAPNSYTGICNGANWGYMPPGNGNHSTTNVPSQPAAPYVGKTIYYHSTWTNVLLVFSTDSVNFVTAPMTNIGPGRTGSERLYKISGIGVSGEPLQFIPTDGQGNYDHAPPGYGGGDYYTTLDVAFLQDTNVFNYRPPPAVSAPRIINSNVVSTFSPSPSRGMRIYLPRGYTQNTWKRYPVVYMHDGTNCFSPSISPLNGHGWDADLTATKEISQGRMRECIIVAVDNSANRTREYLPPEDNSGGAGFGDAYAKFLLYNVKAKIDAEFRTLTNAENTVTVGSSSGGLITTYLGWATNGFGKIGSFSPAYLISPNFNNSIQAGPKRNIRIFTETGNVGSPETSILPYTWTVLDYFLKDGYVPNVDLISKIGCGQAHGEDTWASWMPDCYHFLLDLWDEPNRLAQSEFPPRLAGPTNDVGAVLQINYASLAGESYRLEHSTNATAGGWSGIATSQMETLPWAYRYFAVTNTAFPNFLGTFRVSALATN